MKHVVLTLFTIFIFCSASYSQNKEKSWMNPSSDTKKIELKVFPNPVTDYFNITDNNVVQKVVVFNMVGRPLKQFSYAKGREYRLSDLAKGIYLIQMLDNRSKILSTKRITKR